MMRRLILDGSGASAAEFAIVLPLLLVFLFGIIDAGGWIWTYNRAEKATQMGARMAAVTDPIEPGIASSYLNVGGLTQGDRIPASAFGKVTCWGTGPVATATASCTCSTAPCPTAGTADSAGFRTILTRMQLFLPELRSTNVQIEYSSSGLGYAGDPNEHDLSPVVTVRIGGDHSTRLQFTPITTFLLKSFAMPTISATLTGEDLTGAKSN